MSVNRKKKNFVKLPKYPGGNREFREFIATNLRYPSEALESGTEGAVIVEYDIIDTGMVENPRILKGIGNGCDEEAMRVVAMLRYEKVHNRGLRVKMTTKATIRFSLPPGLRISYSQPPPPDGNTDDKPGKPDSQVYGYTITF